MRFACDLFKRLLARSPLLQQCVVFITATLLQWVGGGGLKHSLDLQEFPPNDKDPHNAFIELTCL